MGANQAMVPREFWGRFRGSMDLQLENPTPEGRKFFTLTSGDIDYDAEAFFGRGYCHWLAGAIHSLTGFELITYDYRPAEGSWAPAHTAVKTPNGTVLDIFGDHDPSEVVCRYEQDGHFEVRTRCVPTERFCGEVITGADENRGDPMWWAKGMFGRQDFLVLVTHFARVLLVKHGYGSYLRYEETPSAADVRTAPDLVRSEREWREQQKKENRIKRWSERAATAGGSGMSLTEQARAQLAQSLEKAEYIRGALRQATLDSEGNAELVSQVSTESQSLIEAAGCWRQINQQLTELHGLIDRATELTESYSLQLAA